MQPDGRSPRNTVAHDHNRDKERRAFCSASNVVTEELATRRPNRTARVEGIDCHQDPRDKRSVGVRRQEASEVDALGPLLFSRPNHRYTSAALRWSNSGGFRWPSTVVRELHTTARLVSVVKELLPACACRSLRRPRVGRRLVGHRCCGAVFAQQPQQSINASHRSVKLRC